MQNVIRRWLPWYCGLSGALLLLAFLNEGLNVGGAWRWGQFDGHKNVLAALRMTFYSGMIEWEGPGLTNHIKSLVAYSGLLVVLAIVWLLRGRLASWSLPIASGLLLLSIIPAYNSASQLDQSIFELRHGSRYGHYDRYRDIEAFAENGKVGFKDEKGQVLIPARFSCVKRPSILSTPAGIVVGIEGKQTIVDFKGDELFPAIYDEVSSQMSNRDWIRAKYQGKWGFIDSRGKVKLAFEYEQLGEMGSLVVNKPLAAFREAGKWGYMGQDGKQVLKPSWDQVYPFFAGVAAVKRGDKACYINESGVEVVPCEFESALAMIDMKARRVPDLFWVTQHGKTGIYDSREKRIAVPMEYDSFALISSEVKRVPEGYKLVPSNSVQKQANASEVIVAVGQKPDIPWARYEAPKIDPKEQVGFSKERRLPLLNKVEPVLMCASDN
jgi:hypothetical protein